MLIASFVLIATLVVGLNALATSRVIKEYLLNAQTDRLERDLDLVNGFYQQKMNDVISISRLVALDPQTIEYFPTDRDATAANIYLVDQVISRLITTSSLDGTRTVVVIDHQGNFIAGRSVDATGVLSSIITKGNWAELPIVAESLATAEPISATEVIPAEYLAQVGLEDQARVDILNTPKANPLPYDDREGSAGLAMVSVYPLSSKSGSNIGAVITIYMFNNDFGFVDYLKEQAQVETTTIFLGDMRISTNVMDEAGQRAVGTRVSQDVYEKTLIEGLAYSGRVYVVNDWYIGSYQPLLDFRSNVVGIVYVGVRETVFNSLIDAFNARSAWIAAICVLTSAGIAIPIARRITNPIASLVDANRRLAKGDMNVRVDASGEGEIALLCNSFNTMVETLIDTEKELLQQAKLASVGQLAAGVAHELNNPLGTILLYSGIMLKEAPADDPRRSDLEMITHEVQRCKKIVSDLLNFARENELSASEVEINDLVEEVISRITIQPAFSGVSFVRDYTDSLPYIQADAAQLHQVFVNLFSNAADAMESQGTITISTRMNATSSIEVRVADSGCGITEENLGKLFTPFFTTKPTGKGTGLGLSIVYGIIKLHHGQIAVQSKPGKGTTVIITLPLHLPEASARQTSDLSNLIM